MVSKVNRAREANHVGKLKLDPELSRVAAKHTKEMTSSAGLVHTDPEVLGRRVTKWVVLGENIGAGRGVSSLHEAFMKSNDHRREILLASYAYIGVGTRQGSDGRLWVTVVFEGRDNPGTRLKMPSCG